MPLALRLQPLLFIHYTCACIHAIQSANAKCVCVTSVYYKMLGLSLVGGDGTENSDSTSHFSSPKACIIDGKCWEYWMHTENMASAIQYIGMDCCCSRSSQGWGLRMYVQRHGAVSVY